MMFTVFVILSPDLSSEGPRYENLWKRKLKTPNRYAKLITLAKGKRGKPLPCVTDR